MKTIQITRKCTLLFILLFVFNSITYCQNISINNKVLSIQGYKSGEIPLSVIKQATKIDIKEPYTFLSANIYLGDKTGNKCVGTGSLNGNLFDDTIKGGLKTLNTNSLVVFADIKVSDKSGKIFKIEDTFFIVASN